MPQVGHPFEGVVEWRPVSQRWFLHRAEPLMHERMWGCSLPLAEEQRLREPYYEEAGYDAAGRPIARRQVVHPSWASETGLAAGPVAGEMAVVEDGATVVRLAGRLVARTTYGPDGLPERTDYNDGTAPERYWHDERGRLVAIDESDGLWATVLTSERTWTGGRLQLEHDDAGLVRIASENGIVWERITVPWETRLRDSAGIIADACLRATREACEREGVSPGTEVFALMLTYVDQGSLHPTLSFGMESDRRAWRAQGLSGEELAIALLYVNRNHEGLNFIEDDVISQELDDTLLREACIQQTDDPYRVVLGAVAARLARADWSPMLCPTDDFVVYIAEHDEGFAPKVRSIREHNPPEQVARWEAAWPPGTPRGGDEPW